MEHDIITYQHGMAARVEERRVVLQVTPEIHVALMVGNIGLIRLLG